MEEMEKVLKPDRYEHSIGVAYTAASMAMVFGADIRKALTAGILHDCAKNMSSDAQLKLLKKHDIEVSEIEIKNPSLLHAKTGMYLAESRYGIEDPEILSAIRWHTTGCPGMSTLDKIIYVADFIEPGRKMRDYLVSVRKTAFSDLDLAVRDTTKEVTDYLKTLDKECDPMTMETLEYYDSLIKERRNG